MLDDSLWVNKLRSGTLSIQSVSNRTCGRVLYIRASRKTCTRLGDDFPFSHLEIRLASVNPSICATFFCEYPAQCLYFLSLLGNRPLSMHRVYAITGDDIRQGKLLIRQILWKTQTQRINLSLLWAHTRLKNLYSRLKGRHGNSMQTRNYGGKVLRICDK